MSDSRYTVQVYINGQWRDCDVSHHYRDLAVDALKRRRLAFPDQRFRVIRKRTVVEIVA